MHHGSGSTIEAEIEFPRKGEVVVSHEYTIRIAAPADARSVEVAVDGGPFSAARPAMGHWWFDWCGYRAGCHLLAVRVTLADGYVFQLPPAELEVVFAEGRPSDGKTAAQYSVVVPNEPGVLAKLMQLLARERVDVHGLVTERLGGSSAVRVLASKDHDVRGALENAGFPVLENRVFHLEIPNRLPELYKLASTFAEDGINILSLYSIAHGSKARCVVAVDQPELAARSIARSGFPVVDSE